jgi:hypothetical protein
MSTKLHDPATHALVGVSVAPKHLTAGENGAAVDLIAADGNGFAILSVGQITGDSAVTATLEESHDATTWAAVSDVSFPVVDEESAAVVRTFTRTRRYVRAVVAVSGDDHDVYAGVLVGGQKKTV